jgi:cysteine-rich repeat protein
MYIVSYNQDASDEAEQIFDQILSHWRFNGNTDEVTDVNLCLDETTGSYVTDANSDYIDCQWDGDCFDVCETEGCSANVGNIVCDAQKGKLTRDMVRLLDVVDLSTTLDEYGSAHRHCEVTTGQSCDEDEDCPGSEACVPAFPTVQSGTFVPALSNSIWSSWNASLANELGTSIPVDPINEFYDCSEEGFDEASCWNGEEGTFLCPENSHVYGYQSIGGEAYNLYAVLESQGSSYTWAKAIDVGLSDEATVYVEYPTAYAPSSAPSGFSMSPVWCDGSRWGDSTLCGDGTQGSLEACEIGDTMVVSCTDGSGATGVITVACLSDCSAYQSETEAEAEGAACEPYACGNGVVEIGEICDDGDLNGTYGHCDDLCGAGDSIYCGDGYLASSEACDCGTTTTFATVIADENSWAAINACDVSNGQYSSSIDVSCAYNCTQPGLACGDGRTNGSEDCDGDYEDWEGSLCSDGRTTCTSDDDCEGLDTCGDTGYETPGIGFVCVGGDDAGYECERDSDCESEVCSTNTYNLYRYRVCESDCTWPAGWTGPVGGDQQCGNGIVEGDEACDDGNTSNNDECLNTCVKNICGDDYMLIGVESCDDGEQNGIPCEADYEDSCNYCDVACVYKTTSGGYCGDGVVDPGEMCDGGYATLLTYYDVGTDLTAGSCDDPDTSITKEGIVYSCHWLGICDGGEENGDRCTLDYDKWTVNGGIPTEISDNIFNDSNSCSGGECVPPVCADDCGSSCPVDYVTTGLLVQSEAEGALPTDSISLYSYLNSEGNSPDNGVLYVPACTVATSISADIDDSDVNPPDVDIVFVTDLTGSMDNLIGDSRKIDLAVESTVNAIEDLFDAYSLTDSSMRIGLVSYTTDYSDVSGFCNTSVSVPDGAFTDSPLVDDSFESELISLVESYATCVSPQSGSTPTYNGLQEAVELMNSSTAEVQVIIILTDGDYDWIDEAEGTDGWDEDEQCGSNYIKDFNNHRFFAKSACAADMYDELVKDSDIFFYTAAITSNDEMQALTAHISSNECEWDEGSDSPDDATSAARDSTDCTGNYAYTAETDDAIQLMYEAIVDSILGTQVTFTATNADGETTTTTGEVQAGENVVLPFPDGFVCQSREQDIPLRNVFYGDGMMSFSDFNLTYCPYQ